MDVRQEVLDALEEVADDEDVEKVLDELMGKLDPYINELATKDIMPHLGLATTIELINELHTRSNTAFLNGEEWPVYRTTSGSA